MSGKRAMQVLLGLGALALLAIGQGCSPSSDLGGAAIPNALPDTRLTGTPPTLREADFVVKFFWTGNDPDGRLRGFQWKMSDNGQDGISVIDTITVDPATGAVIHPWRFTAATDSSFIVTADAPGFPDDGDLPAGDRRSYQTHTLFVRAVDEDGGVDPTPAMISFTSTTLTPTISVTEPSTVVGRSEWTAAPPTVTLGWTGADPDFELGTPVRVRYIWKEAKYGNCLYINGLHNWNKYGSLVLSNSDSGWSNWLPYMAKPEDRRVTFPNQADRAPCGQTTVPIGYIFAIQAMDTAGAVTPYLTYGSNVINLRITRTQSPLLTVFETYLGEYENTGTRGVWGPLDIAQNQPLEFSWSASASGYAGIVEAYRYGWDVADVTNEADPGWQIAWGLSDRHRFAPIVSFSSGLHTLTIEARDNSSQLTRVRVDLNVVPVPPREQQRPLLLIDDVKDQQSNGWLVGGVYYDRDNMRDDFWNEALAGNEQVYGFNKDADIKDMETSQNDLNYAEIVKYRNLLWAHKKTLQSFVDNTFNMSQTFRYNWLGTYQQQVGNVFLCGQQVLNAFVGDQVAFRSTSGTQILSVVMPLIFDTAETYDTCNNTRYALGWGYRSLPNGTQQLIGPTLYPPSIWGISSLDQAGTTNVLYLCAGTGQTARKAVCSGLKAIILDPGFKAQYVDPNAIADTIFTWPRLDAADYPAPPALPDLTRPFAWSLDEFYDRNITSRTTALQPQTMPDGSYAIEPMFKYYARYDWIDDVYAANGQPDWPRPTYDSVQIARICGNQILSATTGRTKVEGATVAFLSHKTELTKPGGRGDVLWGFDPSRFDRDKIVKAVRWVLREQFGVRFVSGGAKAD